MQKIIEFKRNKVTEESHFADVLLCDRFGKVLFKLGNDEIVSHRSCMKPLALSLLFDMQFDKLFNEKEIAVMTSSHGGESFHIELVQGILDKFEIDISFLKCPASVPISKQALKEFIIKKDHPQKIYNNCSGKHAFFLAVSKLQNWDLGNYLDFDHPLQRLVKEKIAKLCCIFDESQLIEGLDGCNAPVFASRMSSLARGFSNIFNNEKYARLKNAFLRYPQIISDKDRLDCILMNSCKNIIAKNGACGLICIYNTKNENTIVIKMSTSDTKARALVALQMMKKFDWINANEIQNLEKNEIFDRIIKTGSGKIAGRICFLNDLMN